MDNQEVLSIDVSHNGDFVVLKPLVKELTFKNSKQFLSQTKQALEEENVKAILDLEKVEIIDSMSLGTLVALLKYVRKFGGDLCITNLSEPIKVLFSLLNFNSVFQCFHTVEDAVVKYNPNA